MPLRPTGHVQANGQVFVYIKIDVAPEVEPIEPDIGVIIVGFGPFKQAILRKITQEREIPDAVTPPVCRQNIPLRGRLLVKKLVNVIVVREAKCIGTILVGTQRGRVINGLRPIVH